MMQSKGNIRLAADLQSDSIVDGPGLRTVIWTQGCGHHCKGCQNPQTWDFNGGGEVPIDMVLEAIDELEYQAGITFSGGDPMYQIEAFIELAKYVHECNMNVWVYTGFTYEELIKLGKKDKKYLDVLKEIDILVDGPFVNSLKSFAVKFRGSSNQRIINVPESLKKNKVILEEKFN
jgi:anaerobic ribonucleoside-triphosphate reductase activating protein